MEGEGAAPSTAQRALSADIKLKSQTTKIGV